MSSALQILDVVRFLQLTVANLEGEKLAGPVLVVSWPGEVILVVVAGLEESLDLQMFQSALSTEQLGSFPH